MITLNDWIAVTPFPKVGIKTNYRPGLALMEHTVQLQKLTVVYEARGQKGEELFLPGDTVYLKADAMKHQWAGEVFTEDGTEFILIPRNLIVGGKRKE